MESSDPLSSQSGGIPAVFIQHAAEVLGDTSCGLSGGQIVGRLSAYAVDFNVDIPYASYPFPNTVPNKRTALYNNLLAFNDERKYQIIRELCDLEMFRDNQSVRDMRLKLITRYGHLDSKHLGQEVNEDLVEQTRHWLAGFPDVLKLLDAALQKYQAKIFARHVLDDLRLGLEKLAQHIVDNRKSLENQTSAIGSFIKTRGGSTEFRNMLEKLMDYYTKYQNTYVKHDDAVNEHEVEFMLEMTAVFMKQFVRLAGKQ